MIEDSDLWSIPEAATLKWRSWAGEGGTDDFVVFNSASGETHFLNLTAALVLRCLEERRATAKALMAEIRDALPPDADTSGLDQIPELLEKLDEVGLITRAYP
jgi:PqqD family protein of HPr-rel-A system